MGETTLTLLTSAVPPPKVYTLQKDFSTTIAGGSRSSDTDITNLQANKIKIVGVVISSENDTKWRVKFYSNDTFDGTTYATNTFIGNIEITSLSANAVGNYEGDCEADLLYQDKDRTKELHVILENTGVTTSKALLTFLYIKAD